MKKWLQPFFITADVEDESYLRLLRGILSIALIGLTALLVVLFITQPENTTSMLILGILEVAVILSLWLSTQRIYWPGQILIPGLTIAAITIMANLSNGMHDTAMAGFPLAVVLGGLILGRQAIPIITLITLTGVSIVAYRDMAGLNPSFMAVKTGWDDLLVFSTIQIIIAASLSALMNRLDRALQKSRENEQAQRRANEELRQLQASLEEQIAVRTLELEQRTQELSERSVELELANIRTQKRAAQLQAIADTTRAIANVRNLNALLPRIVNVVSERFGFYHVGIFLVDESNQFAILSAANSEGGKRMLARGHRLEVGGKGIVGYVTGTGLPRIALDTGTDAVFFDNPDLPETRSEMAIPLIIEKQIIGVLDLQSKHPNAFTQEDIEVLSTLAEQISLAIETARLFEQSQKLLAEARASSQQYVQREWSRLTDRNEVLGFRYTMSGIEPLPSPIPIEASAFSAPEGIATQTGANAMLAVPIQVRGESIGVLTVRVPEKNLWKRDEVAIVKAVAERVGISADNARLYEESQRRAEKERTIGEISQKLSSTTNLENIFRTALQELGQLVPGAEMFIALDTDQRAEQ
ncbi:MAG: GAF domain-containing protein [Anaerolineales bacterium]|nr:GAF domain-containing protein [Anaerolineales bacterium]MDW8278848.1 GAF domain-containing protein [Anaerolineales bacterium]